MTGLERVCVLGAAGQLGRELLARFQAAGAKVEGLTRAECDLAGPASVAAALDAREPGLVVNCAAYNWVDRAQQEPSAAFAVNAAGVARVAEWCAGRGVRLVHFSTDYVFDGRSPDPYDEDAEARPVGIYALSKYAGEEAVRAVGPNHLIVRTCGLYGEPGGAGKPSIVETLCAKARAGQGLRMRADLRCTPTRVADLAEAVMALVAASATGTVHATNSGSCTWHEFALELVRLLGAAVPVEAVDGRAFPQSSPRPANSVLVSRRLAGWGVAPLPPWQNALARHLESRQTNARA